MATTKDELKADLNNMSRAQRRAALSHMPKQHRTMAQHYIRDYKKRQREWVGLMDINTEIKANMGGVLESVKQVYESAKAEGKVTALLESSVREAVDVLNAHADKLDTIMAGHVGRVGKIKPTEVADAASIINEYMQVGGSYQAAITDVFSAIATLEQGEPVQLDGQVEPFTLPDAPLMQHAMGITQFSETLLTNDTDNTGE